MVWQTERKIIKLFYDYNCKSKWFQQSLLNQHEWYDDIVWINEAKRTFTAILISRMKFNEFQNYANYVIRKSVIFLKKYDMYKNHTIVYRSIPFTICNIQNIISDHFEWRRSSKMNTDNEKWHHTLDMCWIWIHRCVTYQYSCFSDSALIFPYLNAKSKLISANMIIKNQTWFEMILLDVIHVFIT